MSPDHSNKYAKSLAVFAVLALALGMAVPVESGDPAAGADSELLTIDEYKIVGEDVDEYVENLTGPCRPIC